MLLHIVGWVLVVFGAFFLLLGFVNLFRTPDAHTFWGIAAETGSTLLYIFIMALVPLGFGVACLMVANGIV